MKLLLTPLMFCLLALTAACGSNSGANMSAAVTNSSSVAASAAAPNSASASNASTSGATVAAASLTTLADNFTTADGLQPAWGSGSLPASGGVDPLGAFRMICGAGQILYDDPLVFHAQPGKSHLHQFYGNLSVNANSTYQSIRQNGGSTCGDPNSSIAVNRSAYWMPAMLDGAGNVVKPEYVAIYYKRLPKSDPRCTRSNPGSVGDCVGIPAGLSFITGYNMQGGANDASTLFYCQDSDLGGAKAIDTGKKSNIADAVAGCPVGARLTLNIGGPDCWDGVNLDSPDHRSHVSHSTYVWDPNLGSSYQRCDDAHPYYMPQVSIIAFYVTDANFAAGKWHLSSDEMVPGAAPGTTFHADYVEGWSPNVRDGWLKNCIDAHMSCSGGELGDGTQIKGMTVPNTSGLVRVPAVPQS
jgi:Domain of unknown function (DUF1996)